MAKLLMPFFAEGVRVACIMATGDVLAQTVVDKKAISDVDLARTARFASVGLFFVGPVVKCWYGFLDSFVPKNQPALHRGVKKMLMDQILMAPIFTFAIVCLVSAVNGESQEQIENKLKKDYITIMKKNYMLWPAAQLINFSVIPVQWQVVFAQSIAVIWNTYLSMVLNK